MIEDWHDNGCKHWEQDPLNEHSGCISCRELDVFVLFIQVNKVDKPLKRESRANKKTGEEKAIWKERQYTELWTLVIFDRKSKIRKFRH